VAVIAYQVLRHREGRAVIRARRGALIGEEIAGQNKGKAPVGNLRRSLVQWGPRVWEQDRPGALSLGYRARRQLGLCMVAGRTGAATPGGRSQVP
jgi:hypothetical protein